MLRIKFPRLSLDDAISYVTGDSTQSLSATAWERVHGFLSGSLAEISIDNKDVSELFETEQEFWLGYEYMLLNNNFYGLLTNPNYSLDGRYPFRLEGGLIHIGSQPFGDSKRSFPTDIKNLDLSQAMEEVIRAVREYKDFCYKIATRLYPEDPLFFLSQMIGYEEHYTKKIYEDASYDWAKKYKEAGIDPQKKPQKYDLFFGLEKAWNEYKKSHQLS